MFRFTLRSSVSSLSALLSASLLVVGCGNDDDGGGGTGGTVAVTGGVTSTTTKSTGGKASTGGSTGTAVGTSATGGNSSTGMTLATGGVVATGGIPATGGTTGTAVGTTYTGGAPGVGGVTGAGGIGGATSTGGASSTGGGGSLGDAGLNTKLHVYVGCADSTGTIQIYSFNGATSALSPVSTFLAGGPLSNAEWNDAEDRLYIAYANGLDAKLSTLSRSASNGALSLVGSPVAVPYFPPDGSTDAGAPTTNAGPQTLTFDRTRAFLAVPNYFSGYVYTYSMASDGTIDDLVSWHSAGKNAHHAAFTKKNDFMLVPYLGADKIEVYQFDASTGAIAPSSSAALAANSGPRHIALHANGKWLYTINEVAGGATSKSGTIDFLTLDPETGTLAPTATFEVPLPTGYSGVKKGSEIEISPAGDLLFVSMRLDGVAMGSVVSYRIDQTTGALSLVEQESSHGATPRQFALSNDGNLLLVGNQDSDNIALFAVDSATGDMTFIDDRDVCDSPRFIKVAEVK